MNKITDAIQYQTNHTFKVWLHKEIKNAIFNYSLTRNRLNDLEFTILLNSPQNTIDFLNILYVFFIQITENYLKTIRNNTLIELKRELVSILDELSMAVSKYCKNEYAINIIRDKVQKSKTELQNEISTVSEWFNISTIPVWKDYVWSDLVDVTENSLQYQFPNFNQIQIKKRIDDDNKLIGITFDHLYDVLQILYSNAIIHSKILNKKKLEISISILEKDKTYELIFSNNISGSINNEQLSQTIKRINDDYQQKHYLGSETHNEGGTGLLKLLDIVFGVLEIGENFLVVQDDNHFVIKLTLSKERMQANEE